MGKFFATLVATGMLVASGLVVGSPAQAAPAAPTVSLLAAKAKHKVTVPANYVYNPKLGSLHDYCTNAPDTFPAPHAKNASFRGPCARHDLCIGKDPADRTPCDDALKANMYTNCEYYYGRLNPLRYACKATALVYWAAVVIATKHS
jgi:hypothetical protein